MTRFLRNSEFGIASAQRFGFSSSASTQPSDKGASQVNEQANESPDEANASAKQAKDAGSGLGSKTEPQSGDVRRRRSSGTKRTAFSDSDEEAELSMDDLVKLVAEKEELLKMKHKEIEKMQDKVLRSYADMENVIDRTKREAENSKKFAIQNFAKNLLDVADNLGRASSVVKDSFAKIDTSGDSVGAVPLLKTLLEGVEMTEKQLTECKGHIKSWSERFGTYNSELWVSLVLRVFRKFGVEKYDPMDEHFDPHRHHAVFQIPSGSKPPGTVAAVLKPGYMLYERVLRPAEVGVTEALNGEENQSSES
ncbi:hypothetical protein QJS10_CPA05g00972 [Acorus calamus]|uniref:GrpE protein homolog n=1 Tax=Acorus calamus TaxID=4465 RepID=A0AAV9ETG5_ACOCL|nr:hypothetical protein QJS10_CPA05g00972 [Acorus calamus]